MKKIKHSKFKNTGFIFELLVRQVTAEIMSSNKSVAEKILKEYLISYGLFKRYQLIIILNGIPRKEGFVIRLNEFRVI